MLTSFKRWIARDEIAYLVLEVEREKTNASHMQSEFAREKLRADNLDRELAKMVQTWRASGRALHASAMARQQPIIVTQSENGDEPKILQFPCARHRSVNDAEL